MLYLIAGILIFIGIHSLPHYRFMRQPIIDRIGILPYRAIFSLISLSGIVLVVYGYQQVPLQYLWNIPPWGAWVTKALMLPALFLLVVSRVPSNMKRITPHPMLWGFTLWAAAHLFANSELAAVVLFGSLTVHFILAIVASNLRGAERGKEVVPMRIESANIILAVVLYMVLAKYHVYLSGVPLA